MNNTMYRKTMENLRNRIDARLDAKPKILFKMDIQIKPYVLQIFDNDLVAILNSKVTLTLNKPSYIRMCIFELIKVLMCEFYYDYIKNKYGNNTRLLFTDTDSLVYEIKTEDVYKDFRSDKEMFDFSNYLTKSK